MDSRTLLQQSFSLFPLIKWKSAMASPSDAYAREAAARKQNKAAPFKFLVPLIYAPVLPLSVCHFSVRTSLRKNAVLRDRVFTVVLAGAFAHGFYLVTNLYDSESK